MFNPAYSYFPATAHTQLFDESRVLSPKQVVHKDDISFSVSVQA